MNNRLSGIEDAVASLLFSNDTAVVDRSVIEASVRRIAATQGQFAEQDIHSVIRRLEERFSISMKLGMMFAANDYRPWLDDERGNIDWYYWDRYKRYLLGEERYSPQVIRSLDNITDQILTRLRLRPTSCSGEVAASNREWLQLAETRRKRYNRF